MDNLIDELNRMLNGSKPEFFKCIIAVTSDKRSFLIMSFGDGENIPFLEDLFDGSELEDNLSDKKNLPTESGVYKCIIRFHSFKSNRPDDPVEWDSNITIESCELIEISFD
jgi:hypothetical protein